MTEGAPAPRVADLRDRLSRLSAASVRINESLDVETVLQEVLDSACHLTGARYGTIVTGNGRGEHNEILSSGLSPEEHDALLAIPEGERVFEFLSQISAPLRAPDVDTFFSAAGVHTELPVPVGSFLGTPMRHRGMQVGHFFLGEKEGGSEFTAEDAETLVMFASQAALVVSNARRYRDEQRARADLEALVNTSPVGVVVLDAKAGLPLSLNREATRIFGRLGWSEESPELEGMTLRRGDGREVPVHEFPLEQLLGSGETVRAEEMAFSVPDGRSVSALVNATPIHSTDGEIVSFVVTLQDLAPLEELERMRAEFLGMVSHELRTPLTSIRGSATTMLDDVSAFAAAEVRQFLRIIVQQTDHMQGLISNLLDMARIETGSLSVDPAPADTASIVDEARQAYLSAGGRHEHDLSLDVPPDLPLVMADQRRVVQVLGNLLSNAANHSEEPAPIRVTAVDRGAHVAFSVSDEGRGIPAEQLPHLFKKYSQFQGNDRQNELDSSGLGLAICKGIVEAHGGRIWAESDGPGCGARFTFTIPVAEEPKSGVGAETDPGIAESLNGPGELERILVLNDDPQTLKHVRDALSRAGYAPIVAGEAEEALRIVGEYAPQLVLLDLMLPGTDGFEVLEGIQAATDAPVIFLSAYGQEEVVARALDAGAADYIVKPFAPTELTARIRAALRKRSESRPAAASGPYRLGDLTVNYSLREVTLGDRVVPLTATEFQVLAELSAAAGRVLTYGELLRRVWRVQDHSDVRPVRTIVKNLRRKLGDPATNPRFIFNEPRVGYRMPKSELAEEVAG